MTESEPSDSRAATGARIQIDPQPSPEEMAAILVAVQSWLESRRAPTVGPSESLWKEAGRTQALRGALGPARAGWLRSARLGR